MRRLTFPGFLDSYVRALSGQNTLSLSRLVSLADADPRLFEPLLLWAVVTGRAERLTGLLDSKPGLATELRHLAHVHSRGALEDVLSREDSELRPEYAKVWRSFTARRDAPERDRQLRLAARQRALELESCKSVTRYRMAKALGLNPGNLHAFLAQGDATKLSLERAIALVEYLEAA